MSKNVTLNGPPYGRAIRPCEFAFSGEKRFDGAFLVINPSLPKMIA
jgi:hypothetical protein